MAWTSLALGSLMMTATLGVALFAGPAAPAAASGSCPVADTCVSMPGDVGSIVASPTTGLANDQWVNLSFSGFQPGSELLEFYCADTGSLTKGGPPCIFEGTSNLLVPYNAVKTFSVGSDIGDADMPVQVAESSAAVPFMGRQPFTFNTLKPIVCDGTSANPCAIEIIDASLGISAVTSTNTVLIPITFSSSSGCPNATLVPTVSEFGIEQLLPKAGQVACAADSSPVLAFNTALDGEAAVSDLASGDIPVAFTDDPEAPDEQSALKSLKDGYALIPVALSANVIGFRSVVAAYGIGQLYPKTAYRLTPTQVAGLVSSLYVSPSSSDLTYCSTPGTGGWCADPNSTDCSGTQCSIMAEENGQAGYIGAQQFAATVRSDPSGGTHQLFEWLCHAPNVPLTLYGNSVSEPATAADVLVQGFNANLAPGDKPYSSCPTGSDTFPSLQSAGTTYYAEVAQPFQQLVKLAGPGGLIQPTEFASISAAGFAPMNWAEAIFNGLDLASLENNQGNFVQPTATSLDAAVTDATVNPDGSLAFDYSGAGSAASYPMPDLIYAAVAKAPQSASSAAQERSMLRSILNLTGGADTADLPAGFVPLPTSLYRTASADLTTDIVSVSSAKTTTTTSTKSTTTKKRTTSTTAVTGTGTGASIAACDTCGEFGGGSSFVGTQSTSPQQSSTVTSRPGKKATSNQSSTSLPPVASSVFLEPTANRLLLPWLGVAGLVAVLWGLLLLAPPARRRILAVVGAKGRASRRGFVKGQPGSDLSDTEGG